MLLCAIYMCLLMGVVAKTTVTHWYNICIFMLLNRRLDSVTHRLPMHGHSYLPCDREFGEIERMQKIQYQIKLYTKWNMVGEQFEVTTMEGRQRRDFKRTLAKYHKRNTKDWKVTQ